MRFDLDHAQVSLQSSSKSDNELIIHMSKLDNGFIERDVMASEMKLEIMSEQIGGETATVHVDLVVYHCKDPNCYSCEYDESGMEEGMQCTECDLGYKLEDGACTELTYV